MYVASAGGILKRGASKFSTPGMKAAKRTYIFSTVKKIEEEEEEEEVNVEIKSSFN
jgi:hypothetical protein